MEDEKNQKSYRGATFMEVLPEAMNSIEYHARRYSGGDETLREELIAEGVAEAYAGIATREDTFEEIRPAFISTKARWAMVTFLKKQNRFNKFHRFAYLTNGEDFEFDTLDVDTGRPRDQASETYRLDYQPSPEHEVGANQQYDYLRELLKDLGPPSYRRICECILLWGMSYEETANHLEIPDGTVMSGYYRARRKLMAMIRERTEDHGITIPAGWERDAGKLH